MSQFTESLFKSTLRSFLKAFFVMVGLIFGFFLFLLCLSAISSESDEIERKYEAQILPNAEGVRKRLSDDTPVILQLNIDGFIGSEIFNFRTIQEQLTESREGKLKNNRVKALFLVISSSGGSALDSDSIYRALLQYKKQYNVPIYAFVDGICASGGYYIACASDEIYASDASLIGSIGVLVYPPSFNVSKVMKSWEVESETFSAGKGKDSLNPFRPWKEGEGESTQRIVNTYYDMFVDIVLKNRKNMTKEELVQHLGAEVFTAEKAKEYGYIDEIKGTRQIALTQVVEQLGFEKDKYQVMQLEKNKWYSQLFSMSSPLWSGKLQVEFPQASQLKNQHSVMFQ